MFVYLLIPILLLHATALSAETLSYSLLQVEDGDTLVIDVDGNPTRVQLLGIDAPEDVANPKLLRDIQRTGKSEDLLLDLGQQATRHLQQLVGAADKINVEGNLKLTDKYGRIPVIASLPENEFSLNATMVQQGYAITLGSYSSGDHVKPELIQLEEQARNERAGLWRSSPELMQAWSGRPQITH